MRYRLMATYRGAPYEAGIGPANGQVVLFAACPPPEELGFEPATGHWRKELPIQDVQAVWESRPVGMFRGERCVVLDDLGDRLHIGFLGHDGYRAEQLGYWQVDRGVFELVAARDEVTEINEERTDYPGQAAARPAAGTGRPGHAPPTVLDLPVASEPGRAPAADGGVALPPPPTSAPPLPLEAEAMRAASQASRRDQPDPLTGPGPRSTPGPLNGPGPLAGSGPHTTPGPLNGPSPLNAPASGNTPAPLNGPGPLGGSSAPRSSGARRSSGQHSAPSPLNGPGPLASPGPRNAPAPLNGPGPLNSPGPLSGPAPASSPAPASGPAPAGGPTPLSAPDPLTGPSSRGESGRANDRTAARLTPPPGPEPTGPGLLEPASPLASRTGSGPQSVPAPRDGDVASRLQAAPVTGELPVVSQGQDRLGAEPLSADRLGADRLGADRPGPAAPSFAPKPPAPAAQEAPAKPDFRPGPATGPRSGSEPQNHLPARDFPAGTPMPPSAVISQPGPQPPATGTNQAGPAALPIPAPVSSGPLSSEHLNGASPVVPARRSSRSSRARGASTASAASADSPAGQPRRRRSAKRRMATERIFGELASLAAIPSTAYSVGEEVDGAMCLLETADGFEVFTSAGGSRHEVRVFSDEESACFYLFGVLAADAVRTGVLVPGQVARDPVPARPHEPLAGLGEPVLHR
jgi:hypothetical protein